MPTLDDTTRRQLERRCADLSADDLVRLRADFASQALRAKLKGEDDADLKAAERFVGDRLRDRTKEARKRAIAAAKRDHERYLARGGPKRDEERKRALANAQNLSDGPRPYEVVRPGVTWGGRILEIGDTIRPVDVAKARKLESLGLIELAQPVPEPEEPESEEHDEPEPETPEPAAAGADHE